VCGLIGAGGAVPGLELRRDLAEGALATVAVSMGLTVDDFAWRAVDIAQGTVARTLSTVVSRQGYDIRDCTMVAYGGGGPIHAGPLAARLGIQRVLVPLMAPVFSAFGCCMAEVGVEAVRTHRCMLLEQALPELGRIADELAAGEAERLGERQEPVRLARWLELRYLEQNAELSVPWMPSMSAAALAAAFGRAHEREYGFSSTDPIEVTAVRCRLEVASGQAWPVTQPDTDRGDASATLTVAGGERLSVPVMSLKGLRAAGRLSGPALISVRFGSITVSAGQVASIDADANVILETE
jgi:N-methylhydantoinase A